jgi:hypothetical protein
MFRAGVRKVEGSLRGLIIGGGSVVAGIALATATTFGVVKSQTSGSFDPKGSVLQYGTANP